MLSVCILEFINYQYLILGKSMHFLILNLKNFQRIFLYNLASFFTGVGIMTEIYIKFNLKYQYL